MKNENSVVRIFFAKMKPEYFQLSEEQRTQFMSRDRANLDALGMKAICMIDCTDSDDEWDYIGVESWPSMKVVEEREKYENETLHISKFVKYKTHVGIEQSFQEYGKLQ
jgi:hypothetical protein